jgi:hypothetical protein
MVKKLFKKATIKYQSFRDFFYIKNPGLGLKSFGNINWKSGWIMGKTRDVFLSIHLRPKYFKNIKSKSTYIINEHDLAVIIQGPINGIEEFVQETVQLYNEIFAGASIIVSTWSDSSEDAIEKLRSIGAVVLLSDPPDDSGWWNIDLQTKSTNVAISYAKERSIDYCIKTRVDHRIYKPNSFAYLKSLLEVFPVSSDSHQSSRLVTTSVLTLKYRIYGVTDLLMFGSTNDMEKYWSCENFKDGLSRCNFGEHPSLINGTPVATEIFLFARYLYDMGEELEWTLEHWWKMLKKYFCVIDAESLDLLATKYDSMYEKRFYKSYTLPASRSIEFSDWLSLYSGKEMNWGTLGLKEEWVVENNDFKKVKLL